MSFSELWISDFDYYGREHEVVFDDSLPAVACYLRVSTSEQAKENHSIETQAKKIRCACESKFPNGAHLLYVSDAGYSGTLPYRQPGLLSGKYRPGLTFLTQLIEHGRIQFVAVYKCNRLTRNLRVWYAFEEDYLDRYNIDFFSATEPVGDRSAAGRFITRLLMASSSFERDQIVGTVQHAMKQRQDEGYPLGRPPYGWQWNDKRCLAKGERPSFEPVKEQAEIVRRVISDFLSGICMNTIRTNLTLAGVTTPFGNIKWNNTSIKTILTSPTHCGLMKDSLGNLVRAKHYPMRIIEEEQYHAVQERLKLAMQRYNKVQNQKKSFLAKQIFAEMIWCGFCGEKTSNLYSIRRGSRYICGRYRVSCDHILYSIHADTLEAHLIQQLERLCSNPVIVDQACQELVLFLNQQRSNLETIIKDLKLKLAIIDKQFNKVAGDYNRKNIDKEMFLTRKSALHNEKDNLSNELERLQKKLECIKISQRKTESAQKAVHDFPRVWENLENEEKKKLASSLIDRIEIKSYRSMVEVNIMLAYGDSKVLMLIKNEGKLYVDPLLDGLTIKDLAAVHCFIKDCDIFEVAIILGVPVKDIRKVRNKLLKLIGTKDLNEAITDAIPLVTSRIMDIIKTLKQHEKIKPESLTLEELIVLKYLAKNMCHAEIAHTLNIPASRLTIIRTRINSKLHVHNWFDTVAIALEQGLIRRQIVELEKPTKRLIQILQHYAIGGSIKYCAEMLGTSHNKVRCDLSSMMLKYGVSNNNELITLALEKGWIPRVQSETPTENLSECSSDKSAFVIRSPLSPRFLQVLRLLAEGYSPRMISAELNISIGRVKGIKQSLYNKLLTRTLSGALHRASQLGLLTPDDADFCITSNK